MEHQQETTPNEETTQMLTEDTATSLTHKHNQFFWAGFKAPALAPDADSDLEIQFSYPSDHPFAIFAGNYKATINWQTDGGNKLTREANAMKETAEAREEKALASRAINLKQFNSAAAIDARAAKAKGITKRKAI